jgi:hypothetical protein
MRNLIRLLVPLVAALVAAPLASAAVAKPAKPVVLKPKWRLVVRTGSRQYAPVIVATDRYVAISRSASRPILIDEQTGKRRVLSPPVCGATAYGPTFGGPWLALGCNLYNLNTGQWVPFRISSQCVGACRVVGIGRYWVKIVTDEGQSAYGPSDYYLQSIRTGQFERDPATPGGAVFDDLSAPSGSRSLCSPLRYPTTFQRGAGAPYLGSISFYGQFALTFGQPLEAPAPGVYRLRRCRSKLDVLVWDTANDGAAPPTVGVVPVASSRALILSTDGLTLRGWLLPSLQRVTIRHPDFRNYIQPVAVTERTIYILANNQLWAAALPSPQRLARP